MNARISLYAKLFVLFVIITTTFQAHSASFTWNGSTGTNWNVALNWTPSAGAPPTSADQVTINSGTPIPTLSNGTNVTITSLVFNGGTIASTTSETLTVTGSMNIASGCVFNAPVTTTAASFAAGATISGNSFLTIANPIALNGYTFNGLTVYAPNATIPAGATISGTGTLILANQTLSNSATFSIANIGITGFTLNGGTFTVNGALVLSGSGNSWTAGTINGSGSVTVSGAAAVLNINAGVNFPFLDGTNGVVLRIANQGKVFLNSTTGGFAIGFPSVDIQSGGLFEIQSATSAASGDIHDNFGGGAVITVEAGGTLRKATALNSNVKIEPTVNISGTLEVPASSMTGVNMHLLPGGVIKGTAGTTTSILKTNLFVDGAANAQSTAQDINLQTNLSSFTGTLVIGGSAVKWSDGVIAGSGTILVNGATSVLNIDSGANSPYLNGGGGVQLKVGNQGKVTVNSVSGGFSMSASSLNIQSGGLLEIQSATTAPSGDIHDGAGGAGVITIDAGGTLRKATALNSNVKIEPTINNSGVVEIPASSLTAPSFHQLQGGVLKGAAGTTTSQLVSTNLFVDGVAAAQSTIQDLELLLTNGNVTGTMVVGSSVKWSQGTFMGSGTISVTGAGNVFNINCGANILNLNGNGGLVLKTGNQGKVALNSTTGRVDVSNPAILVQSGGLFEIQSVSTGGFGDLRDVGTALFTIEAGGTLRKTSASGSGAAGVLSVQNAGTVESQAGTLSVNGGMTQSAGITLLNGGNIGGNLTINGGTLTGTGTIIGNVVNGGGTLLPGGAGPGLLAITGNYTQNAAGTLALELSGATPGTQFDKLAITGTATLGGTLSATYLNNFTPAAGSTFDVVTFASMTGSFATVPSGMNPPLTTAQTATKVTLTAAALILPQFTGNPTAAPNPANIGQNVTFTAVATISNGVPLVYTWKFGDGKPDGTGASVMHAYSAAGTYGASVSVSDGIHTAVTAPVMVTVAAPKPLPPVFSSEAAAEPNPVTVNKTVTLSAAAAGGAGVTLTFTWSFGDGTGNAISDSVTHRYTVPGSYSAAVSVSDGINSAVTSTVTVTVNAAVALVGTGTDSDGDGFSDAIETFSGSSTSDPNSTPFGNAPAGNSSGLTVSLASVKLNFAKKGSDTIKLSGTLAVPAGFAPAQQKVYIVFGDVLKTLTLDAKGNAKSGGDAIKVSIKAAKGVVAAQQSKYAVLLNKGTFAAQLAAYGLVNENASKANVTVPVSLYVNSTLLQKQQTLSYTAKKDKTGTAK